MQANSSHTSQLMAHSMPNYSKILQIQGRRFQKPGAAWGRAAPSACRDPLLRPTTHLAFSTGLNLPLKQQFLQSRVGCWGTAPKQKIPRSLGHDLFDGVMEDHQALWCGRPLPWPFSRQMSSSSFPAQLPELQLFKETAPHIQHGGLVTLLPTSSRSGRHSAHC